MTIKNAKTLPEVFYGLHMVEGVAEYSEPHAKPYRILIGETAIKNMNPTFQGKPVYVDHVDEVDVENIQSEADGYVIESFFNKSDGKNWVKFIAVSDRAKDAIRQGWTLSNAYIPTTFAAGGLWHGVDYLKEVTAGEYEHLAIVNNPRYEESVILTPVEFKKYNEDKEIEIKRLSNSKEKPVMKLNLFKRAKIENAADIESMHVSLPKSKVDLPLSEVIEKYDAILNMNGYANGDHMVKLNDNEEMSVNDLVKKHMDVCNEMAEIKKSKEENDDGGEPGKDIEDCQNDDEDKSESEGEKDIGDRGGDKNLKNEEKDKEEKMKNAKEKAAALKNANKRIFNDMDDVSIDLSNDQVARGKARYGS